MCQSKNPHLDQDEIKGDGLWLTVEMMLELCDQKEVVACDEDIVDIDQKSKGLIFHVSKVQIRVRVGLVKLPGEEGIMESGIPSAGALFEAVEGFVEFAHQMFDPSLDEAQGLVHVNILL